MKPLKRIMPTVLVIILITGALGLARSRIPKEDIAFDVRKQIERLYSDDPAERRCAALALGKIGKPAVEPLIAALKDKDSGVRKDAAEALTKITGKDFGRDQAQWRDWWERNKASFSPNNG